VEILTDKKRTLIFFNILITCIASSMLATALTTALPAIVKDLNISVNLGQWLTSGYSLAMAIMMPLTAFLITKFPTKKLYLSAIFFFILGCVICALSKNFYVMMIGRIFQASGGGILTSMAQVILLTIYPEEKRGSVMGWYGLSIGAAPVIAPVLAGIILDTLGWQMIFIIPTIIMLISFTFAIFVFEDVLKNVNNKFDTLSFILSVFAFGLITLGIGNITNYSLTNILIILTVGFIAASMFVYRQLNLKHPFLEVKTLKQREFRLSVIGGMLLYLVMMGSSVILPLYIQTTLGYSAITSSFVSMPGSLAMAIVSPFAGKIYDKMGMKSLFVVGSVSMMLSNIGMFLININTPLFIIAFYNIVRCISVGCLLMPLVTWGTQYIESEKTAHATALLTSLRTVSGAIGTALFVGIMTFATNKTLSEIKGVNITFLAMAFVSFILVMIAVFGVKSNPHLKEETDGI
jgi:EmrB/QacA subfamily drug resistance transporter